jgi:hypothetical protein
MTIFGQPGEELGDTLVFESLKCLSRDWIVYSQPQFAGSEGDRHPDYIIIHPNVGVIILEVKDWQQISELTAKTAKVIHRNNKTTEESSPVEQARIACLQLMNVMRQDPVLKNASGKLDFPCRYAGILPHFRPIMLTSVRKKWGERLVFCLGDFNIACIEETLCSIPAPFSKMMTPDQIDAVRAIVDPTNVIKETNGENTRIKGILDRVQEELAREPLEQKLIAMKKEMAAQLKLLENGPELQARLDYLDAETPNEVTEAKSASHIRLIRGYAGTGKTDVLILRAHHLIRYYPNLDILITTFNRPVFDHRLKPEVKILAPRVEAFLFHEICKDIYKAKYGDYHQPQSTEGVLNRLINDEVEDAATIIDLGIQFFCREIEWMKELGLMTEEKYLQVRREGRGGREGKALNKQVRKKIFRVFQAYQDHLSEMPAMDFSDLYHKALEYLRKSPKLNKKYDVVLVDEAQHFAPSWIELLTLLVKPGGSILLCDDPSQSVYRAFSWKQKGIDVIGRTRWLRVPYRCTKNIFEAAYAMIGNNPITKQLIIESGEQIIPDLTNSHMREGRRPEVHKFRTWVSEKQFIRDRIEGLIYEGYLPSEIAILHSKKYVLEEFHDLKSIGVITDEIRRETGMEYKVVFLPKINDLFDRDPGVSLEEWNAQQQVTCYMAMTRARDLIFLLMEGKWPPLLKPIETKVDWVDHDE